MTFGISRKMYASMWDDAQHAATHFGGNVFSGRIPRVSLRSTRGYRLCQRCALDQGARMRAPGWLRHGRWPGTSFHPNA